MLTFPTWEKSVPEGRASTPAGAGAEQAWHPPAGPDTARCCAKGNKSADAHRRGNSQSPKGKPPSSRDGGKVVPGRENLPPGPRRDDNRRSAPPGKKHARAGAGKREEPGETACPGGGKGDGAGGITSPDARRGWDDAASSGAPRHLPLEGKAFCHGHRGRCSQPLPRGGAAKKVGPPVKASPKRKGCGIKI